MTVAYNIQADTEQVKEALDLFRFIGGNADEAMRVAINKAGPKIRTSASSEIRKQVRLQAAYVNERVTFTRATRRDLSGRIRTPSRGLLLSRFSTDASIASDKISWVRPPAVPPQGIRVRVKPSGPIKVVGGDSETEGKPFYVVLKSSRAVGIAARLKGSRKFKVFHGPSVSQVFDDVRDDVLPNAGQELTKQLLDAMRYLVVKTMPTE